MSIPLLVMRIIAIIDAFVSLQASVFMSNRHVVRKSWLAHYTELLSTWRRRVRVHEDMEDAMQDTMLRILENGAVRAENPKAYLQRSVANGVTDRLRRETVLPMKPLHELHESEHPEVAGPESALYSKQMAGDLATALEELPLVCRQVYIYKRLEGCSHAEIAEQLGISRAMVEKHMTRTLRHLNARLQQYAS